MNSEPSTSSSRHTRRRSTRRSTRTAGAPSAHSPTGARGAADASAHPLVRSPRDGTPPLTTTIQSLLAWCEKVTPGEALAVDVERASSYRYSARAYLIQVKSESAGILLLDPLALRLPATFTTLMTESIWVLHAARQDLPSLAMADLRPAALFDTEVAARLLGMPRVGLSAVVEDVVGVRLAKEHSAADWSTRPLPTAWLDYAALDVEFLAPVRAELEQRLRDAGKWEWAKQEFAHEMCFSFPEVPEEPWRGLSGIGTLRSPKQLAIARALWEKRDAIARSADIAPFMVMRDKVLVGMARAGLRSRAEFVAAAPTGMRNVDMWWKEARSARSLPAAHLPDAADRAPFPPHKVWAKRHPELHERYQAVRERMLQRAEELSMPVENLMSPGHVRHWLWLHESATDEQAAQEQLVELGARPWQAQQVAPLLVETLS